MDINELNQKIEKKKVDIEKRKNITLKMETKLATLTDEYDIRWAKDDIKSSNYKLRDLEIQLENLHKQVEKINAKNEVERIPVIEEFLEQWKVKAIAWYNKDIQSYAKYIVDYRIKQKQLHEWMNENRIYNSINKENKEKIKQKEQELNIRRIKYDSLTIVLYSFADITKQQKYLEQKMETEKNNKRQLFILRVKEITGNINDASCLSIGGNGEINGIVTGDKGKAKVETISAGGWNIQCYHFRVLVRELI
jgi:hypothetical protein